MAAGINVRVVTSKDLLEYDKKIKEQNATWDDVDWDQDEIPLESGTGSPDCATHLKIKNLHHPSKELYDFQRKHTLSNVFDVYIMVTEGYVPCHRVFLQQKSQFLDDLILDNLKVNTPGDKNYTTITLMDVSLEQLKRVMTLLYTGTCVVANDDDEEDVKDVLRLFQINMKEFKFKREVIEPILLKSVKKKWKPVGAVKYRDEDVNTATVGVQSTVGTSSSIAGGIAQGARHTVVIPGCSTSTVETPSTSHVQVPGPSRANQTYMPLEITKVPPSIPKKPAERIRRNVDDRKASTSSTTSTSKGCNEHEMDEDMVENTPLPAFQKVPPGTALPLNKQARITRNIPRRGRGRGKRRGNNRRPANVGALIDHEDDDSNGPKGKYEQECIDEYVPSNEEVVQDDVDEDVMDPGSDDEDRRPRTRNTSTGENSSKRYQTRQRCQGGSDVMDEAKSTGSAKSSESSNHNLVESIQDTPKGIRQTRGMGGSPEKKGSKRSSTGNREEDAEQHCCSYCLETYQNIEDLKMHLESSCARHITGTYNIVTRQCFTCQAFYRKGYTTAEFIDHIKVCACNAKPSQKRRSPSAALSSTSVNSASKGSSDVQPQDTQMSGTEGTIKKKIEAIHGKALDVVGLRKVSVFVDKLNNEHIIKIVDRIRKQQKVVVSRPKCPEGLRYAFKNEPNANETSIASAKISESPPKIVESVTAPPLPQLNYSTRTSASIPGTLTSSSSIHFDPPLSSTFLSHTSGSGSIKQTSRSIRNKPGPLSKKRRAKTGFDDEQKGEKDGGQINNEPKKCRLGLNGAKENNEPPVNSANNAGRNIDQQTQATATTAAKLQEKIKRTLHPSTTTTGGTTPSDKACARSGVDQRATGIGILDATSSSVTGIEPQNVTIETTKYPSRNVEQNSAPQSTQEKQTTVQENQQASQPQQKTTAQQQQTVQQKPTQQKVSSSTSNASIMSVGSVVETIVENIVNQPEFGSSIERSSATLFNEISSALARNGQGQQPIQAIPGATATNSDVTKPVARNDSLVSQATAPPRKQITPVSHLKTQLLMTGTHSAPSVSSGLGTVAPSRPKMTPTPMLQQQQAPQISNVPIPNQRSASGLFNVQNIPSQLNRVNLATTNSHFTQVQKLQLSKQQEQMKLILKTHQSQVNPVQSSKGFGQPSGLSVQPVMTSQLQNSRQFSMHQNFLTIANATHTDQVVQNRSIQPTATFVDLEVRRVEIQNTTANPANTLMPQNTAANPANTVMPQSTAANPANTIMPHSPTTGAVQQQVHRGSALIPISTGSLHLHSAHSAVNMNVLQTRPVNHYTHSDQNRPTEVAPILHLNLGSSHISQCTTQHVLQHHHHSRIQQQRNQQPLPVPSSSATAMQRSHNSRYVSSGGSVQLQQHVNQYSTITNLSQIPNPSTIAGMLQHQSARPGPAPTINTITTVRLPVTAQMNPLATNRAVQTSQSCSSQGQQQPQTVVVASTPSASSTGSNQLNSNRNTSQSTPNQAPFINTVSYVTIPPTNQNSSAQPSTSENTDEIIGLGGNIYDEEETIKCPDCELQFKSRQNMLDHQSDGMCY